MTMTTRSERPPLLATFTPGEYVEALDRDLRERMAAEATERRLSEEAEQRESDRLAAFHECTRPDFAMSDGGVSVPVPGTGCEHDR